MSDAERDPERVVIPLLAEEAVVSRRVVTGSTVRVATVTHERERLIDEALTRERVEVERVPIGRTIDAVPPVREEGDTMIMPVVEEVVVVERRLILKEEVRIRRVRSTEHHRETVMLRTQEAVITRTEAGPQSGGKAAGSSDPANLSPEQSSERRPVTDGRPVTTADFAERVIEATETGEEAVINKIARVVEEVVLRKEDAERIETVRDTVRHHEVEIEEIPAAETTATRTAAEGPVTPPRDSTS
jgi:stress response protein YsnF